MGLAIFGSSSENRATNTTENISSGADNGALSFSGLKDSNVNFLDGGAIEAIASIGYKALENETKNNQNILDSTQQIFSGQYDFLTDTYNSSTNKVTDAINQALNFSEKASNSAFKFAEDAGRPESAAWKSQLQIMGAVVAVVLVATVLTQGKKTKKGNK